MTPLSAISPIDGRYHQKTKDLINYFSEEALIKYRVRVEIEYFIALCNLPLPQLQEVDQNLFEELRKIYREFSSGDAEAIKEIEKTTNHDVKAVEYFLKEKFSNLGLAPFIEFIHFGLTSQDINNTAIPLSYLDKSPPRQISHAVTILVQRCSSWWGWLCRASSEVFRWEPDLNQSA